MALRLTCSGTVACPIVRGLAMPPCVLFLSTTWVFSALTSSSASDVTTYTSDATSTTLDTSSITVKPIRNRSIPVRWPRDPRPAAAGASCRSMAVSSVATVTVCTALLRQPPSLPAPHCSDSHPTTPAPHCSDSHRHCLHRTTPTATVTACTALLRQPPDNACTALLRQPPDNAAYNFCRQLSRQGRRQRRQRQPTTAQTTTRQRRRQLSPTTPPATPA